MRRIVVRNNSEEYFKIKEELMAKGYGCDIWTRRDEMWSGRDEDGLFEFVKISKWG